MIRFVTVLLLLTLSGLDALCQDDQSEKVARLEERLATASEQEQIPLLNELAETTTPAFSRQGTRAHETFTRAGHKVRRPARPSLCTQSHGNGLDGFGERL